MSALVAQPGISSPTSEEHFRIALNIARMEALNTLYVAAAIRDEKGNPTREAIFAANRILSFSMHPARRAAAGDARPPAPSGGAVERSETEGAAFSSPSHAHPHAPAPAAPNLPQGGGGGEAAGGSSGIPTASSPSSPSTPHSELDTPDFPDDPAEFLALFDAFDDPAEAIASGLNGLMSPEDIVAALARIAANNLARPPDNRAPP